MRIDKRGARPGGAPKRRNKTDGSAIRLYQWTAILIATFIASCAAPDTRHQIVISTREQKLALLDHGNVMAIYPVYIQVWFGRLARQQVYTIGPTADRGKNW